jgi:hypothetical protein
MEVIKIKYHKPKQIFEVALYTRKYDGEVVELEGKGYKRQKCRMGGETVTFPQATGNWGEICSCAFIRNGVKYLTNDCSVFIDTHCTISITSPKRDLV